LTARTARAFTLLEVLIALGIMAVGLTAAIGLFTAATAMHKRAIDQTTAALIADLALADARAAVTLSFDPKAVPLEVRRPAGDGRPPVFYLKHDAKLPEYPGYAYDVFLTPVDAAEPDEADAFFAEARVRWKQANRERATEMTTVILRRVTVRDLK
jgi:prepilin-type N-terminal cleavage/methylation domain-containing protein